MLGKSARLNLVRNFSVVGVNESPLDKWRPAPNYFQDGGESFNALINNSLKIVIFSKIEAFDETALQRYLVIFAYTKLFFSKSVCSVFNLINYLMVLRTNCTRFAAHVAAVLSCILI